MLIDQLGVESILLIETRTQANQVIVHQRPKGVKCAYTKDGDQVLQYAHYSNKHGKMGIIHESVEAAVKDAKTELDLLRQEMKGLNQEQQQLEDRVKLNRRSVANAVHTVKKKVTQKRKVESAIEELRNVEDEAEQQEDIATYVCVHILDDVAYHCYGIGGWQW